jgi:hypothetical protein
MGVFFASVSVARAAVIYETTPPDQLSIYFADTDYSFTTVTADELPFMLESNATITGAEWWGGCVATADSTGAQAEASGTGASCPVGNFMVSIYRDDGILEDPENPGDLVASRTVGSANQAATGALISGYIAEYAYSATFAGIELLADTPYFFAVSSTVPGATWGMETTEGENRHYQLKSSGEWTVQNNALAFRLLGPDEEEPAPVPEPMTLSLLGIGLASVTFGRRRDRH